MLSLKPRVRPMSMGVIVLIGDFSKVQVQSLTQAYAMLEAAWSTPACTQECSTCLTPIC